MKSSLSFRSFWWIVLLTSLWINLSEVLRYFLWVRPNTQAFFAGRVGVGEMNALIFSIWGIWDMLLTASLVFSIWLCAQQFGNHRKAIWIAATHTWITLFVLFWVATANMGLASWSSIWFTLAWAWLEMVIGAWIALRLFEQYGTNKTLNYEI